MINFSQKSIDYEWIETKTGEHALVIFMAAIFFSLHSTNKEEASNLIN